MGRKKGRLAELEPKLSEEERLKWEQEWLAGIDVREMCSTLGGLENFAGLRISPRKWLLFILACIHRASHVFSDERTRRLMREVEPYADGLITRKEMWERADRWNNPPNSDLCDTDDPENCSPEKRPVALILSAWTWTQNTPVGVHEAYHAAASVREALGNAFQEERAQAALLHDIFGHPFLPLPILPASVLVWNENTVHRLAQAIYDGSAFDRLPILADALEEAGCTEAILLDHLRGTEPHVRGCWTLDLILGLTEQRPTLRDVSW